MRGRGAFRNRGILINCKIPSCKLKNCGFLNKLLLCVVYLNRLVNLIRMEELHFPIVY